MKVTVILPIRNEEKYIKKCLLSIFEQSYPFDLIQIIVVDGMSDDNTLSIINSLIREYPKFEIILLENPKKIAPVSMNMGIVRASGDIVIRVDGHSFLDKEFLSNAVQILEQSPEISCVGGPITTLSESNKADSISKAMSSRFGVGNALFRYSQEEVYVDTLAFGAYRKKVFELIGLFNEELVRNQDDELNLRLTKNNGKILLTPKMKSYYYSRTSFKKLWSQYYQYGYWKVRVQQLHKGIASIRHIIPSIFVLGNAVGILSFFVSEKFFILYLVSILSYIILNLIISIKVHENRNIKKILGTSLSFLILHTSYGIGYIKGLVDFIGFKKGDK